MENKIDISVIICTQNRYELLSKTLRKIQEQTFFNRMEVIVIDNASTDQTKLSQNIFPFIKYHYESEKGLSIARNKGLKLANAPIIIFLDDDACPVNNRWAENYFNFLQNPDINCDAAGGEVIPDFECTPAKWIANDKITLSFLSVLSFENTRPIQKNEWLIGANVAYRKKLFDEVGNFNTSLGRKGKSLLSNEELDIQEKAYKKGKQFYYLKDVAVNHFIHANRLKLSWLIKRIYWQGKADKMTSPPDNIFVIFRSFASSIKKLFNIYSPISSRLEIFYKIGRYL